MVGNEQKRFGQFPKHSAMKGSLHRVLSEFSEYIYSEFFSLSLWKVIETKKTLLRAKISYRDLGTSEPLSSVNLPVKSL